MLIDEQEFQSKAEEAMQSLYRKLAHAADTYNVEPDFNSGALSIDLEDPKARFVISPNSPVRQIWISAHSRSFKLDWVPDRRAFIYPATSQSLEELVSEAISTHLGETVKL